MSDPPTTQSSPKTDDMDVDSPSQPAATSGSGGDKVVKDPSSQGDTAQEKPKANSEEKISPDAEGKESQTKAKSPVASSDLGSPPVAAHAQSGSHNDKKHEATPDSTTAVSAIVTTPKETPVSVASTTNTTSPTAAATTSTGTTTSGKRRGRKRGLPPATRKGRAPAVRGLTIPFRTTKKAMKLDPDIPIVQNEAAIMTTLATELFLKDLVSKSFKIAKSRGRSVIKYEDVAEARTKDSAFSFLEMLLP